MLSRHERGRVRLLIPCLLCLFALTAPAWGQGATRDLSDFSGGGATFTVSISPSEPPSATIMGIEDAPPPAWSVSNISDTGTWDPGTQKVKWLFLNPPFPSVVTYDVTPPPGDVGARCFDGTITFDVSEDPITGDLCLDVGIPTVSQWGLFALTLSLLSLGTLTIRNRHKRLW